MTRPEKQKEPTTIYGLLLIVQDREITHYCLDKCREVLMRGAHHPETGGMFLCPKKDCPHEAACTPVMGEVDGEQLRVRKLIELPT